MTEHKVSMIHPNMFNRALRNCGITGLEVQDDPEGDTGLRVEIKDEAELASQLANLAIAHDTTVGMVLDSNVGRLREVRQEIESLRSMGARGFRTLNADDQLDLNEQLEELSDTIERVIDNLGGTVDDYRKLRVESEAT